MKDLGTLMEKEKTARRFVVVTKDFSGLGFATKLAEQGEDVVMAYRFEDNEGQKMPASAKLLGNGLVEKIELDEIWKRRAHYRDAHWHFDQNHFWKEGEALRKEGFPNVWGGSKLMFDMENDRDFGVRLVEQAGLSAPETFEFTIPEEGLAFLDQNEDRAYVFKPNEPSDGWETFVPDSEKDPIANEELYSYLEALPKGNTGGYILQERLRGVEANFEVWMKDGVPFFAFCDLESKKQDNDDLGAMCGGSQDISFTVPLDSKGIRDTVMRLAKLPEFKKYTGFLDMNVIIADNDNYFLEFCARYGYPAHVSLLYGLAKDPIGDIMADMNDPGTDFYKHFKYGFAAGITLYNQKYRKGLPVYMDPDVEQHFYSFDTYKRGAGEQSLTLTAGTAPEVGVMTGHGFSVVDAAEDALAHARKIHFPNREMRTDIDKDAYPSNPRDRYLALEAMRYLT